MKIFLILFFTVFCVIMNLSYADAQERVRGQWQYFENIDLIDDEDRSSVQKRSTVFDVLSIRCRPNGISIAFGHHRFLSKQVVYRFRGEEDSGALEETWIGSSDPRTVFVPQASIEEFLRLLQVNELLVIRVTDTDGQTYLYSYDLTEAREVLSNLSCLPSLPDKTEE